jgi:RHS repeat-associated protein
VTAAGTTSYTYDANGNMTARGSQTITWNVENKPVSVGASATFVYDGDGTRVKKTEGGETVLYINKYYEKNLTTAVVTTSYYLGDRLIAQREGEILRYIHQDHLTGTSVMSSSSGVLISGIKYYPYGSARSGSVPTDKQFTGQRLDDTGLYYYGARYYDPAIGRFISADTVVQDGTHPQYWNRYSYAVNNPLKYYDPSGHVVIVAGGDELHSSWYVFKAVAPDEAELMIGSSTVYVIDWGFEGGSVTIGDTGTNQLMLIDSSYKDEGLIFTAALDIAHESFHAIEGNWSDSVYEEVGAFQFEFEIGGRIEERYGNMVDNEITYYADGSSTDWFHDSRNFSRQFKDFNLSLKGSLLTQQLQKAQTILQRVDGRAGKMYGSIPLLPPNFFTSSYYEGKMMLSWLFNITIN